jgi:hypothetical protein
MNKQYQFSQDSSNERKPPHFQVPRLAGTMGVATGL